MASFSTSICDGNYKLLVEWSSSQNVSNNTSVITVKASLVVNWSLNVGERYNNTLSVAGTSVTYKTDPVRTTGTHVLTEYKSGAISHNADGTRSVNISVSYRFNATINGTYYGTMTASKTVELPTIPRATTPTLSASTIEMGKSVTIYTKPASSSFKHKLSYGWYGGSTWYPIADNVGESHPWTIPKTFANNIPDATSGWGTIRCETYNGSTLIGTKDVKFTATVPDTVEFRPSCTATLDVIWASTVDTNNPPDSPVQGLSKIKVTVNPTLAYGSPIDSYAILIDGRGYSSSTVTTDFLRNKGESPVDVVVTDKRGRSGSWKDVMNVQGYALPTIGSLKVHRCDENGEEDDQGDYVRVSFSATVSDITGNTATYFLYAKKSSMQVWSLLTSDKNGNSTLSLENFMSVSEADATYLYECDGSNAWDFMVVASDKYGTPVSKTTSVSTAFTMMNFNTEGNGMAIGKVAEQKNTVEIALDVDFLGSVRGAIFDAIYPVGSIYLALNHTDPSTLFGGTWERIENRFLWATTDDGIIGNLGGESTHTLTESEMPSHTHSLIRPKWYQGDGTTESTVYTTSTSSVYGSTASTTPSYRTVKGVKGIEVTGGGNAHNNMPPYIQVSAWHRTA